MSIQEHLNKIRNAIYGREVRESIAKGIETAYDDASENGNANMEVKIARGTHPNLRSRLEEVDNKQQQTTAQLAQNKSELEDIVTTNISELDNKKADKTHVWNMSNMGQDVKESMTGDSVAVVGVNSTMQSNIVPDQITEYELGIISKNKNLLVPDNILGGYALNSQDGTTLTESPYYSTTKDFIRVKPLAKLHKNKQGGYVIYDESFNRISSKGNGESAGVIEVPENGHFIKLNILNEDIGSYQLEYGESETSYQVGQSILDKKIKVNGESLTRDSVELSKLTGFESSRNLLNPRRLHENAYINISTGELVPHEQNHTFLGIPISPNVDVMRVNDISSGNAPYVIRNDSGSIISSGSVRSSESNRLINVPDGSTTIDISFFETEVERAMLSEGSDVVEYEPYFKYFTDIVDIDNGASTNERSTHLSDKKIVCFGDSITGSYSQPTDIPSFISQRLGAEVYNVGFGGAKMSTDNSQIEYDAFSMVQIVNAIITGDFSIQEAEQGTSERYPAMVERLKGLDFNDVDIVTIMYGTNDFNSTQSTFDNEGDKFDVTTFLGATRYVIRELQEEYPHIKVVLLSTTWRTVDEGFADDENEVGRIGVPMAELVDGMESVANLHHIPFVNMYNGLGLNRYNFEEYLLDGLHPNPTGRKLMADRISSQLLSNL